VVSSLISNLSRRCNLKLRRCTTALHIAYRDHFAVHQTSLAVDWHGYKLLMLNGVVIAAN
jgi:hypothetical protein